MHSAPHSYRQGPLFGLCDDSNECDLLESVVFVSFEAVPVALRLRDVNPVLGIWLMILSGNV